MVAIPSPQASYRYPVDALVRSAAHLFQSESRYFVVSLRLAVTHGDFSSVDIFDDEVLTFYRISA